MLKDLKVTVTSPYSLAVQLKKWYTGSYNVKLVLNSSRHYIMQGFEEEIIHEDERDEVLTRFQHLGRWTHKMVSTELKKLNLKYPINVLRKY